MKYRALSASQVIVTCGAAAAAIVQFMLLLVPQKIEKKHKPQQNKKPWPCYFLCHFVILIKMQAQVILHKLIWYPLEAKTPRFIAQKP